MKLKARADKAASQLQSVSKNETLFVEDTARRPNFKPEIIAEIAAGSSLKFTPEKTEQAGTFTPIDLLDYIYAVLHSPNYREKYKEFLKIDFPRIPYPIDAEIFWKLADLGSQIRALHLLEKPILEQQKHPFFGEGEALVRKIGKNSWRGPSDSGGMFERVGKVYINDNQYFNNISATAWEFYIGGYQPAQKWLKDRKGRKLTFEEIAHYQKIIAALDETARLMSEIDKIKF